MNSQLAVSPCVTSFTESRVQKPSRSIVDKTAMTPRENLLSTNVPTTSYISPSDIISAPKTPPRKKSIMLDQKERLRILP